MKKFLLMSFLLVSVFFAYSANHVEAYYTPSYSERYVGTRGDYKVYLLTDTISKDYRDYYCTVKSVDPNSTDHNRVLYMDYHFYYKRGDWYYTSSDGVEASSRQWTSIERNILAFIDSKAEF